MSQIRRILGSLLEKPLRDLEYNVPILQRRHHYAKKARDGMDVIGDLARGAKRDSRVEADDGDEPPAEAAAPGSSRASAETAETAENDEYGLTLVRAMIAAARSDGTFDQAEKKVIYSAVRDHGLSKEEQALLQAELRKPVELDALVRSARALHIKDEVYIASLLAIVVDTPEERRWLDRLATALRLDPRLVARIHQDLGLAPPK